MKRSIVRIILLALFMMAFYFVFKLDNWLLWAFIATYAIEDAVLEMLLPGGGLAR